MNNGKYRHWSQQEREEHFLDMCEGFKDDLVDEHEFRSELASLGYNATEIEDLVREHRPSPPENDDGFEG